MTVPHEVPPRLRAVAAAVPRGAGSVADVGAGDGQLAQHLSARGVRVIATERHPGPFMRLRAAAPSLDCRLGEGLQVLRPGEVEGVVLAGLGGHSIVRILAGAPGVVATLRWLVLQPQQHSDAVLLWLEAANYRVQTRITIAQGRHSYTVLLVRSHERSRARPSPPASGPARRPPSRADRAPGGGAGVRPHGGAARPGSG